MSDFDRLMQMGGGKVAVPPPNSDFDKMVGIKPDLSPIQGRPTRAGAAGATSVHTKSVGSLAQEFREADVETGGPLLDRLATAFKFDPTGVENYLVSQYGRDNVKLEPTKGELYFYTPEEQAKPAEQRRLVKFNPVGLDVGDAVEYLPAGVGIGAGAVAAAAASGVSVPAALGYLALGGAAGEAATQAVGAALPGEEAATLGDRAVRVGASAALDTAFGGVPGLGRWAYRQARAVPSKVLGFGSEVSKEGAELAERTGVKLTTAQMTEHRPVQWAEKLTSSSLFSSGLVQKADAERLAAHASLYDKAVDQLGAGGKSSATKLAVASYENQLKNIANMRRTQAAKDFAPISASGAKIFSLDNAMASIDNVEQRFTSKAGGDESDAIVEFLTKLRRDLNEEASKDLREFSQGGGGFEGAARPPGKPMLNAKDMQSLLSRWGQNAYDPRGLIAKVTDPSKKKAIATEFFQGLLKDLDAAADNPVAKEMSASLQQARANYREYSKTIEELAENPLSGFVDSPEKLVDAFLSPSKTQEELGQVMDFLHKTAPDQADNIRAAVLQEMAHKAGARESGEVTEDSFMSMAKFATLAKTNSRQLETLMAGASDEAKQSFRDLVAVAKRVSNTGGIGNSPTQPLQAIDRTMSSPVMAISTGTGAGYFDSSPMTGLGVTAGILAAQAAYGFGVHQIAKALVYPDYAKAMTLILRAAEKPKLFLGSTKQAAALDMAVRKLGITGLKEGPQLVREAREARDGDRVQLTPEEMGQLGR